MEEMNIIYDMRRDRGSNNVGREIKFLLMNNLCRSFEFGALSDGLNQYILSLAAIERFSMSFRMSFRMYSEC